MHGFRASANTGMLQRFGTKFALQSITLLKEHEGNDAAITFLSSSYFWSENFRFTASLSPPVATQV